MALVFVSILKVLCIIGCGIFLRRRTILNDHALEFLTYFVVSFAVPALIFSNIVSDYTPQSMPSFWVFFFCSLVIFFLGVVLGNLFLSSKIKPFKPEFLSLISFQNSGYLPMNLAYFFLPEKYRSEFLVYIFLYLLGFNILMWSVGSFFIFKRGQSQFKFRSLLTPPVVSILLALGIVFCGGASFVPEVLLSPLKMLGETSFVLSMIILGAWLAKGSYRFLEHKEFHSKVITAKLIFMPLFIVFIVGIFKIYSLLGFFMVLQACMPSAASLPIVAKVNKANSELVSQGVFFSHLTSIVTVPLWIDCFLKISSFPLQGGGL